MDYHRLDHLFLQHRLFQCYWLYQAGTDHRLEPKAGLGLLCYCGGYHWVDAVLQLLFDHPFHLKAPDDFDEDADRHP
jgi:hypothetical protein